MLVTKIVVGTDGSDNARRAMGWAAAMARITGAEVVAVHALGMLEGAHRPEVLARLEAWAEPLAGVAHRVIGGDGNPVSVLLDTAAREGADLVVVGSRGTGGHPDLLLGSTSHQVIQLSTCPVVVVPPGWSAGA
jgi:nucleotide-binding universal stress UspA family protein